MKDLKTLADLELDINNSNKGTDRGRKLLKESLAQLGAGRSILVDKNGKIIAGNKTVSEAKHLGLPIEVIRTQGDKLICVQRMDLDLYADSRARTLASSDNRISELDLNWDIEKLLQDAEQINIENLWTEEEIKQLHDELDIATFEAFAKNTNEDEDASENSIPNAKSDSDMLPFNCLLTPQQRERLYEAINQAKSKHGLETTGEALDVIAQEFLNAQ